MQLTILDGRIHNMVSHYSHQEIVCQQVMMEDSSVFSIQWTTFPHSVAAGLTSRDLLHRYLSYIRHATLSIIRPIISENGVEFRLLATRWSLISFLKPLKEGDAVLLRICGGLLVQKHQCDRGELSFSVKAVPAGITTTLQLSDYCPLILGSSSPNKIRYWLYRLTQAAIHRLVTIRFLVLLYRDLAGPSACIKVVAGQVREGHPL
ncbi:MAG: hypothetical protein PHH28_01460 [Desulfuromonadaceae bacterium]|nr:hypothetical protein [Desulfuromonadaceae bacterium]